MRIILILILYNMYMEFRKINYTPAILEFFIKNRYDDTPFLRYGFFSKLISTILNINSVYKLRKIFMKLVDEKIIIKKNIKNTVQYKFIRPNSRPHTGPYIIHFD
jgi:hypothetical protein